MRNFGPPSRTFTLKDRLTYLRVPRPNWLRMNPEHGIRILFSNMQRLLQEGRVVWGHIVQSNVLMFQEGKEDCPAEVVYSLDDPYISPEDLAELAGEIYAYKETKPSDPELRFLADHLTDEYTMVYGLPVPASISPNLRCRLSATYLVRKHLPGRRLCKPLFPLIAHPEKPYVVLPLPERYWPRDFAAWWAE